MGLIMLILVGILPGMYALNLATPEREIAAIVRAADDANHVLEQRRGASREGLAMSRGDAEGELSSFLKTTGIASDKTYSALSAIDHLIAVRLQGKAKLGDLAHNERQSLRSDIYLASETIKKLNKQGGLGSSNGDESLLSYARLLDRVTKFIPDWVKFAVALALGLGTTVGWKRIVVTVGEKIGKEHLTYAQGACAELVAMSTIGIADTLGLPVSTTHVLSSGVAGTMAANRSGLQMKTLRNIALAWLLTLPVCVFLGATLFALALNVVLAFGAR